LTGPVCAENLIANSSFESVEAGVPLGWSWSQGKATGKLAVATQISHSGQRSLFITNSTPLSPNVYSCLRTSAPVLGGRTYTLSAYVRGEKPGQAWICGGEGWRVRMYLPEGASEWTRLSKTFTTEPDETRFDLLIGTDSPTDGFWVDSIQLEEGDKATEYVPPLFPGEMRLRVEGGAESGIGENLIANGSFEVVDGNRPKGWNWDPRNTDATFESIGKIRIGLGYSLKV